MSLTDFLAAVMPTVGEQCYGPPGPDGPDGTCLDWADHICTDDHARCTRHCTCPTPGNEAP